MSDPLVWLPFDPSHLRATLGELPAGLRFEVVDPTEHVPDSVRDVRFYVTPYQMGPAVGDVLPRMGSLEVVQTLSAGVDNVRDRVPEGVVLCNGRGIHDSSTAELTLALVLASLRDVPWMVRDQDARRWNTRWRPALADRRVLLVGYGAIGRAIEQRLLPFETEVVRVARTARVEESGPVHGFDELPALLPEADVVVLICPLTEETRGLVDADLLARMKAELGDLDKVTRILKVVGMVNSAPDFGNQARVVDGASDLFVELYGDPGRHSRSAPGMGALPGGIAVIVDCVIEVAD